MASSRRQFNWSTSSLQAYRSAHLASKLYKDVEQICAARGVRYLPALPNDKSVRLNARWCARRTVAFAAISMT
jgi:hypothetical protein